MKLRENNIEKLSNRTFDVLIVGGGVNGAVSAAALATRGAKVALIDRGDFAGSTSQESSNLAWGGIKYLENYEFALVRNLCKSRNRLIRHYPATVKEIRFLATIPRKFRHTPWQMWLATWLYWFIGDCFTRPPRLLSINRIDKEHKIIDTAHCAGSVEYSDAYFHDNDARFVFNFIRSALNMGCIAANYIESLGAVRENDLWTVRVREILSQREFTISAKVLINATGPFVDQHNQLTGQQTRHCHVFSKGVHLIVDQIVKKPRVLAFFADDGRLFFVIPMGPKTCIGTTDTRVATPQVAVEQADRDFILSNINRLLSLPRPLQTSDIIAERCGVRPLVVEKGSTGKADWMQLSRRHIIEVDRNDAHLSIFGGKLTDCLNIGEEVSHFVSKLGVHIHYPHYRWYGEPHRAIRKEFFHQARLMDLDSYTVAGASEKLSSRLWRRYGGQAIGLLENIREDPRQAEVLIEGTEYIRCEIRQAARREMITKLDDFLRRRSKIALIATKEQIKNSPGIREACQMLFADQAGAKFQEYFGEPL